MVAQHLTIARSLIGLKEVRGPQDNPKIMAMYEILGHDWVEHDEVPWCAAFVGFCLEKAGIRSTRKLNARSYEKFGTLIYKKGVKGKLTDARPGDIVVFKRGRSAWQGHVAFFEKLLRRSIKVTGGNQLNAVNTKPYALSKLVCIVRPTVNASDMTVKEVQQKLKNLGYHEVGKVDGLIGNRTKSAILAFRQDNDLPLIPMIDGQFEMALKKGKPRYVNEERRLGKPEGSRILTGANMTIGTGAVGGVASAVTAASNVVNTTQEGIEMAETTTDTAGRAFSLLGLGETLAPYWPAITAVVFAIIIIVAFKIRSARIEDHREGKTP